MQVCRIHEHGDPSVLRVEEIDRPEPGPGEVLVRVLAVSINHLDLWVRRGMPGVKIPFPRVLGCDGVGEVVALGEGVSGPAVGQRVVLEREIERVGRVQIDDQAVLPLVAHVLRHVHAVRGRVDQQAGAVIALEDFADEVGDGGRGRGHGGGS